MAEHWTATADRDVRDPRVLGEDELGDLWVPSRRVPGHWDRRFSGRRPSHWPAWMRSRLLKRLAHIETGGGR